MNAYDKLQNEGGDGYTSYEQRHGEHQMTGGWTKEKWAAFVAERDAKDAAFAATWTAEVTAERRAAWNALAVKPGFNPRVAEKQLNFTMAELKKAVAMHTK